MTDRVLDRRWPGLDNHLPSLKFRTLVSSDQRRSPRSYTWSCDVWLDQGQEGACVGHGYAHEAAARPSIWNVSSALAFDIYAKAQRIDEWPGEDYSGTSVLAGAKVYKELGMCSEYRWCLDLEDLIATVGYKGPVVIGVNWYRGMSYPDDHGFLRVTGPVDGGHCLLIIGQKIAWADRSGPKSNWTVDPFKSYFLVHNSWGKGWGQNGRAKISFIDMDRLMREQGEFCVISKRLKEHKPVNQNKVTSLPSRRPAETFTVVAALALLIGRLLGIDDPDVITALSVVLGFLPTAITWIVSTVRSTEGDRRS